MSINQSVNNQWFPFRGSGLHDFKLFSKWNTYIFDISNSIVYIFVMFNFQWNVENAKLVLNEMEPISSRITNFDYFNLKNTELKQ